VATQLLALADGQTDPEYPDHPNTLDPQGEVP
jgi:hypothetical protein